MKSTSDSHPPLFLEDRETTTGSHAFLVKSLQDLQHPAASSSTVSASGPLSRGSDKTLPWQPSNRTKIAQHHAIS